MGAALTPTSSFWGRAGGPGFEPTPFTRALMAGTNVVLCVAVQAHPVRAAPPLARTHCWHCWPLWKRAASTPSVAPSWPTRAPTWPDLDPDPDVERIQDPERMRGRIQIQTRCPR